jgi:hypothetical protein
MVGRSARRKTLRKSSGGKRGLRSRSEGCVGRGEDIMRGLGIESRSRAWAGRDAGRREGKGGKLESRSRKEKKK